MEIFLSYRRQDSEDFAGRLYDHLVDHFGPVVFRDVNALGPGVRFDDTIRSTISACKVLLAVVGRNWVGVRADGTRRIDDADDWARLEVERALEHRVQVIPVLSGSAEMPAPADLPASLRPFALRNAIRLEDAHWPEDVNRLVTAIEQYVATRPAGNAGPPPSAAPAADGTAPPPADLTAPAPAAAVRRRRVALAALGSAVPLLVVLALVVLSTGGGAEKRTVERAVSVVPTTTVAPPTSAPEPTSTAPPSAAPAPPAPAPAGRVTGATSPAPTSPPATSAPTTVSRPASTTTTAASAPPPPPPQVARFTISPTSGPVGTTITISADACARPSGWTSGEIYFGLADPNASPDAPDPVTGKHAWAPDASWHGQLVVPPLPPGEYWVYANCYATDLAGAWSPFYEYPSTDFFVR
jgi:hypothetical protein